MSDQEAKNKNSKRRHSDETAIAKQAKIAKAHGGANPIYDKEPHRLAKHHAMDCGQPGCMMCGNPRHNSVYKSERLTAQERRMFQDTEQVRDRHSNGSTPKDEE